MTEDFVPVRADMPCPVCGGKSWCLIHRTGSKVICPRTKSCEKYGEENYLHRMYDERAAKLADIVATEPVITRRERDWDQMMTWLADENMAGVAHSFCAQLGVTKNTLRSYRSCAILNVKAGMKPLLYTPMQDGGNTIIGFQCRDMEGEKRMAKGSRGGIFVPTGTVPEHVRVTEGWSDAACLFTAGYYAIGRVSAKSGYEQVVTFVRSNPHIKEVTIVADNDINNDRGNVGVVGGQRLRFILEGMVSVKLVIPDGYDDIREMYNATQEVKFKEV